jgi:1,4-alpha-glucan branching enzyme
MKKKIEKKSTIKLSTSKNNVKKTSKKNKSSSIKKQYLKSDHMCNVTFRMPKEAAQGAKNVTVVGDFNNWNLTETKMKKLSNGDFTITLKLHCDREYRFRYLIDADQWENDWFADKYIPNPYGFDDSVIVV